MKFYYLSIAQLLTLLNKGIQNLSVDGFIFHYNLILEIYLVIEKNVFSNEFVSSVALTVHNLNATLISSVALRFSTVN